MNQHNQQELDSLAVSPASYEACVGKFFEQIEPKIKKGRAWTFDRLNLACDSPSSSRVQAVLYPSDDQGFTLYARQDRILHPVTYDGRPVCFRTMEKALTTLADVAYLDPEIVVDSSNWREEPGPI